MPPPRPPADGPNRFFGRAALRTTPSTIPWDGWLARLRVCRLSSSAAHGVSFKRPCGLMDKALVFGTKDCRLESCQGHICHWATSRSCSHWGRLIQLIASGPNDRECFTCQRMAPLPTNVRERPVPLFLYDRGTTCYLLGKCSPGNAPDAATCASASCVASCAFVLCSRGRALQRPPTGTSSRDCWVAHCPPVLATPLWRPPM